MGRKAARHLAYNQRLTWSVLTFRRVAPWPQRMSAIEAVKRHILSRYNRRERETMDVVVHPLPADPSGAALWEVTVLGGAHTRDHAFFITILGPV